MIDNYTVGACVVVAAVDVHVVRGESSSAAIIFSTSAIEATKSGSQLGVRFCNGLNTRVLVVVQGDHLL